MKGFIIFFSFKHLLYLFFVASYDILKAQIWNLLSLLLHRAYRRVT